MIHHRDRGSAAKRRATRALEIFAAAACFALFGIGSLPAAEGTEPPMLVGVVKTEQILKIAPDWKGMYDAADPAADAVAKIREAADRAKGEIRVEVVFGSWCSDSLDHVPRFIKVMEQVGAERLPATYVGVDRSKKDPEGRVASLKIERVPIFIVYRKDAEIGRIIETPRTTVEADLAEILSPPAKP